MLEKQLEILNTVICHLPGFIYWKDKDSKYIGGNSHFIKATQLAGLDDLIGKTDYDMPWKEQADAFIEDDKRMWANDISLESDSKIIIPDYDNGEPVKITVSTIKRKIMLPSGEAIILGFATEGDVPILPCNPDCKNTEYVKHSSFK